MTLKVPYVSMDINTIRLRPELQSFFFFSSRRRHTRSLCDWSSDVCSSDLRDHCGRRIIRSEEHTSELQSHSDLVCRLLLEKKNETPTVKLNFIEMEQQFT